MLGLADRGMWMWFIAAGIGVGLARMLADWWDWQPWTVRLLGLAATVPGLLLVWRVYGVAVGVVALAAVVIICTVYIRWDWGQERPEEAGPEE